RSRQSAGERMLPDQKAVHVIAVGVRHVSCPTQHAEGLTLRVGQEVTRPCLAFCFIDRYLGKPVECNVKRSTANGGLKRLSLPLQLLLVRSQCCCGPVPVNL